jgi:zinc protease
LKTNGITDADLQKTIEKAKRSHEMNMRKNRYWMKELMTADRFHFKPEFVTDFDKEIKGLTKASIQEAFKKYYDVDNFISIILKPVQEKK